MFDKLCPLIFAIGRECTDCRCKGERCEWWLEDFQCCVVRLRDGVIYRHQEIK